jgi:hypothetical protein
MSDNNRKGEIAPIDGQQEEQGSLVLKIRRRRVRTRLASNVRTGGCVTSVCNYGCGVSGCLFSGGGGTGGCQLSTAG